MWQQLYCAVCKNIIERFNSVIGYLSRDSSVGRATDCKSAGHGFKSHSRDKIKF